jgi:CheY-like chemotaxis protein
MDTTANMPMYIRLPKEEVRICVVEDNRVNQRFMMKALNSKMGYDQVHIHDNGKLAVEAIQEQAAKGEPYHIVFMDLSMPVMNGFDAAKLIRGDNDESVRNVKLIVMHVHMGHPPLDSENDVAAAWDDQIKKPTRIAELTRILDAHAHPLVSSHPNTIICSANMVQELVQPEPEPERVIDEPEMEAQDELLSVRPRL